MTMNIANIKCLLHCAENILQSDIKQITDFRNLSLYFKILNDPDNNCSLENLLNKLSNVFGSNIDDVLAIINIDFLTEIELTKILLLCIVAYMLTNNSNDSRLTNLCDNIPIDLHQNACVMFAPLIVKYSDKIELSSEDLENALLVNDKENQTTFFSPIRDNNRPNTINDKVITAQKQKIYKEMKAYQSFDPFPIEMCSSPRSSVHSPLVKLVEFVQSPNCKEKMALRKTNKDLEKNVNRLEHQLFWNTNFENELDKTINVWKQKYKNLEKELKVMQISINEKDDIIVEKSQELEDYKIVIQQNKKLEEKVKDYHEKVNEIQILNVQLEEKSEENRLLKIENRESSHFKALAIDRRSVIKTLTSQVENYKLMENQFKENRKSLKKAESELSELQNHFHSLQRIKNDSLSEVSLNSSIYNPESMGGIVEMERDELKNELILLKEQSVPRQIYDNVLEQVNELTKVLKDSLAQCDNLKSERNAIMEYCNTMKEDIINVELIDSIDISNDGSLENLKEIFHVALDHIKNQKENIDQLTTVNSIQTNELNQKLEIERNLLNEIETIRKQTEDTETELIKIKDILFIDNILDCKTEEFFIEVKRKLTFNEQNLQQCNLVNTNLKSQLNMLQNIYQNNCKTLKNEISITGQFLEVNLKSIFEEILIFKEMIGNNSFVEKSFSNTFLQSFYDLYKVFEQQKLVLEKSTKENQELIENLEKTYCEYHENLITVEKDFNKKINEEKQQLIISLTEEFDKTNKDLIGKYESEKSEIKRDMNKIIDEYQCSLINLENISKDYKAEIQIKDNQIQNDEIKIIRLKEEINTLKNMGVSYNENVGDLEKQVNQLNIKLSNENQNIQEKNKELLAKDEELLRLKLFIKDMNTEYVEEIETLKSSLSSLAIDKNELEKYKFEKEKEMISKDEDITKLLIDIANKNQLIIEIEKEIVIKENKIQELWSLNEKSEEKNLENINKFIIVEKECEHLRINFDKIIEDKDNELNFLKKEVQEISNELNKVRKDLLYNDEEINTIKTNNLKEIEKFNSLYEEKEKIMKELDVQSKEMENMKILLKEKENELLISSSNNNKLEKIIEEIKIKQHNESFELDYLKEIDRKYVELTKSKQELEWKFEKSNKEYDNSINVKCVEIDKLKFELEQFIMKENQWLLEKDEIDDQVLQLNQEISVSKESVDLLENKCSSLNLDLTVQSSELTMRNEDLNVKDKIISDLIKKINDLEKNYHELESSTKENSEKKLLFETIIANKTQENNSLKDFINSYVSEINSLSLNLKTQVESENLKVQEIEKLKLNLKQMKQEKQDLEKSILELNKSVVDLKESNELTRTKFDNLQKSSTNEIESLRSSIIDLNITLESVKKEKEFKAQELSAANISIDEFHSKINNLESFINEEMINYEKVSEDYKQIEQESNSYREKYNNLVKQRRDDLFSYETHIEELNKQINRIEEEHDNQIHEIEKSFNSKIFDLQQNLEDKSSELESIKTEITESRKYSKTCRLNLESEKERLQKAITTREIQFSEEKGQLIGNLEKERVEKLKYKDYYEGVVCKLENDMKISKEQSKKEYTGLEDQFTRLNEELKESQLCHFRLTEEMKQKESEFQRERKRLQIRLEELEPLENKINELESTSRRLLNKLSRLEQSVTASELKKLRSEIKASNSNVILLEKEKNELISKTNSLEDKMKNLIEKNNEAINDNNFLTDKLNYCQDQISNFESLDQTRLGKIENIECEINSIKSENESLKTRYLKSRELSESHLEKVNRSHEDTVNNYIERLGSLTKDIAKFQEQVQLLTAEKNMFKEDNGVLKRSVAELTSKLNNLKTVLQEHTDNEVRLMGERYEKNRFSRMSAWDNRPQISRHLPPVNSLDDKTVALLNLDPKSKLRFESYVYSPYVCEDESSVLLQKEFPKRAIKNDSSSSHRSNDEISQISSSIKKKKDGIRQQIATKIRRSLHLENHMESKLEQKRIYEASPTPTSMKSESTTSGMKSSSKPPILPRKKIIGKLKSSQINVIDLDELRHRHEKQNFLTPVKPENKIKQENIYTVSSTTASNIGPSSSMNSLFEGSEDTNINKENLPTNSFRLKQDAAHIVCHTPYTQKPKTPQPNSIIRRLIRKSKKKTPVKRYNSFDKLM